MNLSAYDKVENKTDKGKTWVDIVNKRIVSREIKFRSYYTLLKRFNRYLGTDDYYLACSDELITDTKCRNTIRDNYGRLKFNVGSIWKDSTLKDLSNNDNVSIKLVDKQEDGEVYYLNI